MTFYKLDVLHAMVTLAGFFRTPDDSDGVFGHPGADPDEMARSCSGFVIGANKSQKVGTRKYMAHTHNNLIFARQSTSTYSINQTSGLCQYI